MFHLVFLLLVKLLIFELQNKLFYIEWVILVERNGVFIHGYNQFENVNPQLVLCVLQATENKLPLIQNQLKDIVVAKTVVCRVFDFDSLNGLYVLKRVDFGAIKLRVRINHVQLILLEVDEQLLLVRLLLVVEL